MLVAGTEAATSVDLLAERVVDSLMHRHAASCINLHIPRSLAR